MKRKAAIALVACLASFQASASVKSLSRANCIAGIINESVTYDRPSMMSHFMYTMSEHVGFGAVAGHAVTAHWASTWRSYAGDTGDSNHNTVSGTHIFGDNMSSLAVERTIATDCNLTEW
ncbi:hypothetical protein [Luteibacter aegosomatissinici]|uniref:hypothetical protein n=1 Tax=Luteibacter aegosomatissinici TaxID=2911539 RepID=UPI001FF9BA07|nr:hypothetical protein [Luteibacter aegosomatissinici]UPG93912.1 hypothetical protein L2Y97_19065 [Luteibacter aegosomatissinici]